jgi:hypothetical protein
VCYTTLMRASLSPQDFVDKWRQAELKERAAYQEHFIDLCRLLGHPSSAEADPQGDAVLGAPVPYILGQDC